MDGFWAAGPGWASWVVAGCLFALGLLAGAWWGQGRGWKHCEEDQRWRRAQARARRTSLIDYRPPEIAHEWQTPGASLFGARDTLPPEAIQEEWLTYTGQALALVRPDLTDSAYIQDMGERMDRFLNDLFRVPYSADELWSGQ